MTKQEIIDQLRLLAAHDDPEHAHILADALLLAYIADDEIADAYEAIDKWYA